MKLIDIGGRFMSILVSVEDAYAYLLSLKNGHAHPSIDHPPTVTPWFQHASLQLYLFSPALPLGP